MQVKSDIAGGFLTVADVRFLQLPCLVRREHAKRGADFHAHTAHLAHHGQNLLESALAPREISPGGAHTEPRAPVLLRPPRSLEHRLDVHQLRRLRRRVVP